MPRRANERGMNAIVEIQRIAKQLKERNPSLEHKEAIKQASKIYKGEAKMPTGRRKK